MHARFITLAKDTPSQGCGSLVIYSATLSTPTVFLTEFMILSLLLDSKAEILGRVLILEQLLSSFVRTSV